MPLQDVLARIPGRAGYLAQQQFDQQQGQAGLGQMLGLANFVEQQKRRAMDQQMQQAQLGELQRRTAQEEQGQAALGDMLRRLQEAQQPTQVVASENDSIQTPGKSPDEAYRQIVPEMLFHPLPQVRNVGGQLLGRVEAADARREQTAVNAELRARQIEQQGAIAAQNAANAQERTAVLRFAAESAAAARAASSSQREDALVNVVDPKNPSRVIAMRRSEYLQRRDAGEDLAIPGGGLNPNQVATIEDRATRYLENNPLVKQFTALAPDVEVVSNYMARRQKVSNADRAVYDKNLVNTFMRMTHPKGDQISNFERKDLAGLPDAYDRFKVAITSVFQGKHLPDDIARSMNSVVQEKYGAMRNTVSQIENQAVNTVTRQGGSADAVRKITRQQQPGGNIDALVNKWSK